MKRTGRLIILVVLSFFVVTFCFLAFEGFSSTGFTIHRIYKNSRPLAESLHTGYDEELGWVNLPNIYIEDMYGPGIYLRTNGQMFRNNQDFSLSTPENKARIICSGDSFTLGYGVDNDHTWCQQLASISGQETVNMGQGGYGIDQAYLWYKRDGTKLEHDIHIFAFITDDFRRMQYDKFLGCGKPYLELQDGILVPRNVPVPQPSPFRVWLNRHRTTINELSSIRLLNRLFFQKDSDLYLNSSNQADDQTQELALEVFRDLHQLNQTKDSILVLVYLPILQDYLGQSSASWRQFLSDAAVKNDLVYIDLVDEFRNLPPQSIETLFIGYGVIDFQNSAGHYTEEGNAYIAGVLYEKMLDIPEVSDRLAGTWFESKGDK